jgi:hypothetical protein
MTPTAHGIHNALDVALGLLDTPPCIQTICIWNVLHAAGFTTKELSMHMDAAPRNTRRHASCAPTSRAERLTSTHSCSPHESLWQCSLCITRGRKGTPAIAAAPHRLALPSEPHSHTPLRLVACTQPDRVRILELRENWRTVRGIRTQRRRSMPPSSRHVEMCAK